VGDTYWTGSSKSAYLINSTRLFAVKLGVLTAMVILFGVWVNYATTATRSEVFAATAASAGSDARYSHLYRDYIQI